MQKKFELSQNAKWIFCNLLTFALSTLFIKTLRKTLVLQDHEIIDPVYLKHPVTWVNFQIGSK